MAQNTKSEGTQLFEFDPVADSKPARGSIGLKLLQGVVAIGLLAVTVTMFSAGVVWIVNRTLEQEKTSAGRERLDDEYYDWTQERPKDAKSNRR